MKILHTADWHIGNFPGPEKDGQNLRGQDTLNCLDFLYTTAAAAEHPDIIVVSGDIFHQARVWADRGLSEVKVAIKAISDLAQIAPVVVLRGTPNHDGGEQFSLLEEHFATTTTNKAVYIVTKPTVVNVFTNSMQVVQVACLPGFDRGEYRAKFPGLSREEENTVFTQELCNIVMGLRAQCNEVAPRILLAHYTVPGCNMESGQTPFVAQFEPVIMPETLDAAGFDLVCLGHIHRPQKLESCQNTYYSGAINAMNFNDEGQVRGFWIHEFNGTTKDNVMQVNSFFHETPAREFNTVRLENADVAAYNAMGFLALADKYATCHDKIVRVIYSCTEEEEKALNRAALENDLYDKAGAFWVSEIVPDNITEGTNKNELSEKTNPETNLIEYLQEKKIYEDEEIAAIVEIARPIIAEVLASNSMSRLTGMFVPIEISVKNYRNYVDETFSFKDVTFCTINGKNGAGKSSLFMDAILDALYEEPREGELTAWIRADEKARSGSISFTFAIGEHTFRVVRTRAKSGKATLNLAELIDGEWENRSKERYRDTQEEIVNILGMDSLTFRSCALIMQDQYGLFLQADKEARMSILGNILGLGIYGDMEQKSREALGEFNRNISFAKKDIVTLQNRISERGDPRSELEIKQHAIKAQEDNKRTMSEERDRVNVLLNTQREQGEKADKLLRDINTLATKESDLKAKIQQQERIVEECDTALAEEPAIIDKVKTLEMLEGRMKDLDTKKATYDKTSETISRLDDDIRDTEERLTMKDRTARSVLDSISKLTDKQKTISEYKPYADEDKTISEELTVLFEKNNTRAEISEKLQGLEREYAEKSAAFKSERSRREAKIQEYERKIELLSSCNCVDIDNANCQFLADAKEAAANIEAYRTECHEWETSQGEQFDLLLGEKNSIAEHLKEFADVPDKIISLRNRQKEIEPMAKQYGTLSEVSAQLEQQRTRYEEIDSEIDSLKRSLADKKSQRHKAQTELDYFDMRMYLKVKSDIDAFGVWRDKQSKLPIYRERKDAAASRIVELDAECKSITEDIGEKHSEREGILASIGDVAGLTNQLSELDRNISETQSNIDSMRMAIGTLTKTIEDIEHDEEEIRKLQSNINKASVTAAHYDILKHAFSQDGVPHNIIRTIVPILTATSNSILGQMTGGKMGMQFVTDKIQKSNKKEVATLDIVIEEYGKDALPYLSKSGGEKVKASLSAILALAEIKSSQAGIQLGMLFIDEPPFLDEDGTQAYCDALDTIQHRYNNIKIMAITHDPTFKARFPQNLDVVKSDEGSRVIFE